MKLLISHLFLSLLILSACTSDSSKSDKDVESTLQLNDINWLLGTWENHTTSMALNESWVRLNDTVFVGIGTFMEGEDTLSSESIRLEQHGSDLYYVPVVSNQNQGEPVQFKLKEKSQNHLVFENPTHDFPQNISYTLIREDSMVARIFGSMEGKYHEQDFPFTKFK